MMDIKRTIAKFLKARNKKKKNLYVLISSLPHPLYITIPYFFQNNIIRHNKVITSTYLRYHL